MEGSSTPEPDAAPQPGPSRGLFSDYPSCPGASDELLDPSGAPREDFRRAVTLLGARSSDELARSQALAELSLLNQGVTFSVYSDNRGAEKIFPFCLVPRMVAWKDWSRLQRGLEQRVRAIGLFLDDVYGEQKILADKPLLRELVRELGVRWIDLWR